MAKCCSALCCVIVSSVFGIILLIAGGVFLPVSKNIIHNQIKKQITLNSSDTYDNWIKNPTPIYFEIYFWNLTNPDEVKAGTAKPYLAEIGPYVYKESRQKVDIHFHDNNFTVTYRENKIYTFDQEKSKNLKETDKVTTVNIIMMLLTNIVKREYTLIKDLVEILLEWSKEEIFTTYSVADLLWGYDDPLINKTLTLLDSLLHHKFPISDKFGVFVGTNGTDDGIYNIKTGQDDSTLFGMIHTWNNMTSLPYWTTTTCNMVNGTDGTIFHPFVEKSDVFYVFSSDLCRSIYVTYERPNTQKGIDVYRFTTPPEVFMYYKQNPANRGFCTPSDNCLPSGLLNMENCHDGAPLIFSQPHFLNADKSVIDAVEGMHPDPELHGTFIDIEPNTGAAFFATKKLQVNIQLFEVPEIKQTAHLPNAVLPVLWLNEHSQITDSLADKFKSALQTPMEVIHAGIIVAFCLGGILVLLTVGIIVMMVVRKKKYTKMENLADEN